MASKRFEMVVPEDLWLRIEAARGHEPRGSFVKRMVEEGMESFDSVPDAAAVESSPATAPPVTAREIAEGFEEVVEESFEPPSLSRRCSYGCVVTSPTLKRCVAHNSLLR